jgi:hypothetical protein
VWEGVWAVRGWMGWKGRQLGSKAAAVNTMLMLLPKQSRRQCTLSGGRDDLPERQEGHQLGTVAVL